jgi:selenocysteine lyase/cysteine desulfurase
VHSRGGILLLDACQTLSHHPELIEEVHFDAVFGSGHKMYGPSIGFTVIKKDLLLALDCFLIGGSTVQDVQLSTYQLIEEDEEIYSRIEPGLQNYAGIIGLDQAILWRQNFEVDVASFGNKLEEVGIQLVDFNLGHKAKLNSTEYEQVLSKYLNRKLNEVPNIKLLYEKPSPVVSLYSTIDSVDGHKIAMYLSQAGIMCRSGYHCCHYYLKEKLKLPPLFRISLALHNNLDQIDYLIDKLKVVME